MSEDTSYITSSTLPTLTVASYFFKFHQTNRSSQNRDALSMAAALKNSPRGKRGLPNPEYLNF
jgi:hypothetical protein